MMNTSQPHLNSLSDSDLELLSAYIDNQLSVAERVSLERRLQQEVPLQRELEDLKATTRALRELPPLSPPRSFTLDPARAPRRSGFLRFAGGLQFGSGLAGLALVLLASLQLFAATSAPVGQVFTQVNSGLDSGAIERAQPTVSAAAPAPPEAQMNMAESTAAPGPTLAAAEAAMPQAAQMDTPPAVGGAAPAATAAPLMSAPANMSDRADTPALKATAAPVLDYNESSSPSTATLPPPADPPATPAGPPILFGVGLALLAVSLATYLLRQRS